MAPPPEPHEISDWPIYEDVNSALRGLSSQHQIMIINDTIIFYPKQCRQPMIKYAAQHGTDWLKLKWAIDFAEEDNAELHRCQIRDDKILKNTTAVAESIDAEKLKNHHIIFDLIANLEAKDARLKLIQNKGLRALLPKKICRHMESLIDSYYDTKAKWHRLKNKSKEVYRQFGLKNLTSKFCEIGKLYQHEPKVFDMPNNAKFKKQNGSIKISIVTPSFNQGIFIEETIQSIIGQKYSNLEYIIQDGGSSDDTVNTILKYESQIHFWESKQDKGQSDAINLGFSRSSGDIMAWLNSDDILVPGTLSYIANYFVKNPNVDVVYGNRLIIDKDSKLVGKWVLPDHRNEILKWADYVPQETMFWRRSIWDQVGGINPTFKFALDWDFICRMIDANAKIVHIPKFFGAFRAHSQQKTATNINTDGISEMELIRGRYHSKEITGIEIENALQSYYRAHIFESKIKQKLLFTSF
jgi:glycosyltransferase involved in cell wall biosynthesis